MNQLIFTFILTFVIIMIAIVMLGIGYLLTGKTKIRGGSCSRVPGKPDVDKEGSCNICGRKPEDCEEP